MTLYEELVGHLLKEEQILFPMIRQLESATGVPVFHCGSVANPIRQMEWEHDNAGKALAIMNGSPTATSRPSGPATRTARCSTD